MVERIAVIGAGIAGLCTALALAPSGRQVVLYERDAGPPAGGAEEAFDHWARRGAGQLRHSHGFLARLRALLIDEHPALMQELRDAGARELGFAQALPETLREGYRPAPDDEDLAVIVCRRTTIEMVIRRYVERQANVTIESETFVRGLVTERDTSGALVVRGLKIEDVAGARDAPADLVIDASGRTSPVADWLAEAGVAIAETAVPCSILYYTRFYRLLEGQDEPPRGRHGGTGDLGFLKFGVFAADNRTFSLTLAVPEVEEELRKAVVRPEIFDAICAELPGIAPWTDPARSEPASRVFGMGDLQSRWRAYAPEGKAAVLGLIPVGESLVRTNPLYGRGCSFAAIEAHLLRDVMAATADPAERLVRYCAGVRETLGEYYDDMVAQDRAAARRALNGLDPDYRPRLRARLMRSFAEDAVTVAIRADIGLLREAMRAFHMLAPPRDWLKRPATLAKIMAAWARGRRANARFYPPKVGPDRWQMFDKLGLPAGADLERVRAQAG